MEARDDRGELVSPRPAKAPRYTLVDAHLFFTFGMEMIGKSSNVGPSTLTGNRRFRQNFGVSPRVVAYLWDMLDPYATIIAEGVSPEHLLWSLMLLKFYAKETTHCAMAGGVDEKSFRKWSWIFIDEVSFLEGDVVS
jgi:hypothetical protein